ncbi:hypothetical protein CcI49_07775 [Frankia sp. CcI49]|uniref:hypothetical protein n=1 Tax=Frankia sp. CcI49 TaxID=1745382 RepID=UPI00097633D9|nr:hypothetical protein [Frankia sp. CcI49]ONH61018.1 hypothetical protein CcI49_07775 [Frankia sp. CcI49]
MVACRRSRRRGPVGPVDPLTARAASRVGVPGVGVPATGADEGPVRAGGVPEPQDLDYRFDLDLGELVPGAGVVARGVRLDGAALTLFFVLRPCAGAAASPGPAASPGRALAVSPARPLFMCSYRPGAPVDDGLAGLPVACAAVEVAGSRCRATFPPPVTGTCRVRFGLRPWEAGRGPEPGCARGVDLVGRDDHRGGADRTGPAACDPGGDLCLDLRTGRAVYVPADTGNTGNTGEVIG